MTAMPDAAKASQTYAIDKTHSEVAFEVRHLLTKVRGRFTEFTGRKPAHIFRFVPEVLTGRSGLGIDCEW